MHMPSSSLRVANEPLHVIATDARTTGRRLPQRSRAAMALAVALLSGCPDDGGSDEGNLLPTQGASSSDETSAASMTSNGSTADSTGGTGGSVPVTYRFECIDIQTLGDADGTAFQANLLEDTWNSDVDNYKLNIMFEVATRDEGGGMAQVGIRSGVGAGPDSLCAEASSQTDLIDVTYDASTALWSPMESADACSVAAAPGAASGGSYTMTLTGDQLVYIYAQDDDGTTFNCTEEPALPDAVPVRAVEAQLTAAPDGSSVAGQLTGCLLQSEAAALCSCLGMCNPATMSPACGGCPNGSVPLQELLLGINPSPRCTDLLGMDAYDLQLGFTATALPNVPSTCG